MLKGYASFSGNPAHYGSWMSPRRALMYETGQGEIMTGAETAPADLTGSPSETLKAAHKVLVKAFKVKKGKLHTRLVLATTDCPEGYDSPAAINCSPNLRTDRFGWLW